MTIHWWFVGKNNQALRSQCPDLVFWTAERNSAAQGGESWNIVSGDGPKADINSSTADLLLNQQRILLIFPRLEGSGLDPY